MLDKIRELAMEKFASVEEVDAFMAGFEKSALFHGNFGGVLMKGLNNIELAKPLGALAVGLAGAAIIKSVSSGTAIASEYKLRGRFDMALAQVMSGNKIVRGARPEKVKDYAETIFRFAPHVASDPNLLASTLANVVQGEGIDANTVKMLVELEGRYTDNNRTGPWATLKT